MEETYANALKNSIGSGTDEATAVSNLMKNLKATGRTKLLPAILRALKRITLRSKAQGALVEVANEHDKSSALKEAREAGIDAEHATVNSALISGWRARKSGALVDRSGKRMLTDIYQNVVSGT